MNEGQKIQIPTRAIDQSKALARLALELGQALLERDEARAAAQTLGRQIAERAEADRLAAEGEDELES